MAHSENEEISSDEQPVGENDKQVTVRAPSRNWFIPILAGVAIGVALVTLVGLGLIAWVMVFA